MRIIYLDEKWDPKGSDHRKVSDATQLQLVIAMENVPLCIFHIKLETICWQNFPKMF